MKCSFCQDEFEEKDVQESHDVPCYLFWDLLTRRERKQKADKYGRRWLCKQCHDNYELWLKENLILIAQKKAKEYFNG